MSNERSVWQLLAAMVILTVHSAPLIGQQQCLRTAWKAMDDHNYDAAIHAAETCIHRFANAARQKEQELRNVRPTPEGRLPSAERTKVLEQGILNDVAAACIVKGEAAEELAKNNSTNTALKEGYKKTAIEAYEAALEYRHALVSDGNSPEAFWSPCQAAAGHLRELTGEDRSQRCR